MLPLEDSVVVAEAVATLVLPWFWSAASSTMPLDPLSSACLPPLSRRGSFDSAPSTSVPLSESDPLEPSSSESPLAYSVCSVAPWSEPSFLEDEPLLMPDISEKPNMEPSCSLAEGLSFVDESLEPAVDPPAGEPDPGAASAEFEGEADPALPPEATSPFPSLAPASHEGASTVSSSAPLVSALGPEGATGAAGAWLGAGVTGLGSGSGSGSTGGVAAASSSVI